MSTRPNGVSAAGAAKPDSNEWNEEQLEAALKRLKELHVQVRTVTYDHCCIWYHS